MKPIKIFLADLTHTGVCIATENIPLNIGLLASHLNEIFKGDVNISLFKYPNKLLSALQKNPPHILGVSNYVWNSNLSEWACRKAKQINPKTLTVQGGWNFPLTHDERIDFLLNRQATDIYVINEGEIAFSKIIESYFQYGPLKMLSMPLPGCAYLDRKQNSRKLILGDPLPRICNLDSIPSPYVNGLLDEFFDGNLTPIIETTRGCPFTCTYCNSAHSYYTKVRHFSDDYVLSELDYISKKVKKVGAGTLFVADTNFGMYPRDIKIAEHIANLNKEIDWPQHMFITTGKNRIDLIFKAVDYLKDLIVPSLSMQSMNPETQKEIKRSNLKLLPYNKIVKNAENRNLLPIAELIVPLPKETIGSYWEGIEKLINMGNIRIISYTLQLNHGTIFREKEFIAQHDYKSQYRLVPNDFGIYDEEFICEAELVATSSKYLSFEDYLEIRCFTFYLETMYSQLFEEYIKFVLENGLSRFDYVSALRDHFDHSSENLQKILASFILDTKTELFNTEADLKSIYSNAENYEKLKNGMIGANVVFKHKALAIGQHLEDLIDYITFCLQQLICKDGNEHCEKNLQKINSIRDFCKAKLNGLFDPDATETEVSYVSKFDIKSWFDDKSNKKLDAFEKVTEMTFIFNDEQKHFRNDCFTRYGISIPGKAKILARVPVLLSLARVLKHKL